MAERYLVDEYGTVIETIKDDEFLQIKSQKSVTKWKEGTPISYPFIKCSIENFPVVGKKYSIFVYMLEHLNYIDNTLVFSNGRVVKTAHLAEASGMALRTVQKQIKAMIDEDIIRKMKFYDKTMIVINPWICMKGNRVNTYVYEAFENSVWKDRAKGSVKNGR